MVRIYDKEGCLFATCDIPTAASMVRKNQAEPTDNPKVITLRTS